MNETTEKPLLTRFEVMEIAFGLCTLAALMWLLWWNGFEEIREDQLSLRYFREILSLLVLGQMTGVIGILGSKWKAKTIRTPRWIELVLGLIILSMLAGDFFNSTFVSRIELQNIFRMLCLCYGAAPLLNLKEYFFRQARRNRGFHLPRIRPALLFLITLLAFITLGGTLLMSPGATKSDVILSPTDAYFISTSAVCVTGLVPINVHEHFTNYGQTILLVLFQVGAFGIMTFTYFVSLMVGQGLSLRSKVTISNLLDEEGITQVDRFIKSIIAVTFGVEAIGAVGLYFSWRQVPGLDGDTLWWYAVFHSVSGFCNAGFSLFTNNLATPSIAYNMGGQITIMAMVLCGSLGFAMYLEIVRRARVALGWDQRESISRHWSTYSWLVVRMTTALVLGGGLFLFFIKVIDGSLFTSENPWYWVLWESLFNATVRTAGFNIADLTLNSVPYALFLGVLMFIGGNPGSTTGGVHTTAFAISCGEVARILQGKKDVVMNKRRIARNVVERAVITVILAGAWVGMMTMIMCFAEPHLSLECLFFEVASSFATVGFSWNVTPELSDVGKWIIVFNMIVGRVGMVAFVLAFMKPPAKSPLRYPETRIPLS